MKTDNKQIIIENSLDEMGNTTLGYELLSLTALQARKSLSRGKVNQFITGYSQSLGFTKHLDTAYRIVKYLYPENTAYWQIQDKRYINAVKSSAWFKSQL